jgi:hypothetical protein
MGSAPRQRFMFEACFARLYAGPMGEPPRPMRGRSL